MYTFSFVEKNPLFQATAINASYLTIFLLEIKFRQISTISRTKSPNLYVSRLVLQLSLCNLLKPGVQLKMTFYIYFVTQSSPHIVTLGTPSMNLRPYETPFTELTKCSVAPTVVILVIVEYEYQKVVKY